MIRYANQDDSEWGDRHLVSEEKSELQKYRFKDPLERTLSIENETK